MRTDVAVGDSPSEQQTQHDPSGTAAACSYPEFDGPGGKQYLRKLLRQILPMALYRTWEICADHQAKGQDCYLSLPHLATLAGRSLRTMQKNLASLHARGLLVERAERKIIRRPDGSTASPMVVVKDFAALSALAHDYHLWLQADEMIPAQRCFVTVMAQNPVLVAKLRHFDNYRRLLSHHLPGSLPVTGEEDLGWTESRSDAQAEASACPPVPAQRFEVAGPAAR